MPFTIVRDDLSRMHVDAVVNPTGGVFVTPGGTEAALIRAAGGELRRAIRKMGNLLPGETCVTPGFGLDAEYVIHTRGPVWKGGNEKEVQTLKRCYLNCLSQAERLGCRSIAFPLIATGAFGFPPGKALEVATEAIGSFLLSHDLMVSLVVFSRETVALSLQRFPDLPQYIDDVYVGKALEYEPMRNMPLQERIRSAASSQRRRDSRREEAPVESEVWDSAIRCADVSLEDRLGQMDEGFSQLLLRRIDEKGLTDSEVYHRANLDRRLFSKIRCNPEYHPRKPTVLALAVALRMDLEQTRELLESAGFTISHSHKMDVIVEYCILHEIYDIFKINELLFSYDQELLGSM